MAYVAQYWGITFSIPGMNKWLHRQAFSYKKTAGVPHKFSEEKQQQFIEYYEKLKDSAQGEPILFLDAVHPTQATRLSYGWILRGHKKAVQITGSRTQLNILGALNLNDIGGTVFQDYQTIDELSVSRFFNEIRVKYSDYRQKIHLIVDGAGYNKTDLVKNWAYVSNIELHYLPPYSPNLNAIERLWKVMNEHARNNRYFASKHDFRDAIFNFFRATLPEIAGSLTSRINDNFQVLKNAS